MKRYSVDTSYGDCAVGFMADDPGGDYVEFQPWMERMQWRSMDSAPRDGTPIIVTVGGATDRAAWVSGVWATAVDDDGDPSGWYHEENVTAWMPMPEPMK